MHVTDRFVWIIQNAKIGHHNPKQTYPAGYSQTFGGTKNTLGMAESQLEETYTGTSCSVHNLRLAIMCTNLSASSQLISSCHIWIGLVWPLKLNTLEHSVHTLDQEVNKTLYLVKFCSWWGWIIIAIATLEQKVLPLVSAQLMLIKRIPPSM